MAPIMKNINGYTQIIAILFMLLMSSEVHAAAVYDAVGNTITLGLGVNTLPSLYADISNSAVLDYDGINTYTLYADISGQNAVDADLVLENCILKISASRLIKTWSDVTINNMTISGLDSANPWKIWLFARYTSYSLRLTDSDISGGRIVCAPNGYVKPNKPIVVQNNYFHDTALNDNYILSLQLDSATGANVSNNIFRNIHLISSLNYDGIIKFHGYSGLVMDQNTIENCSTPSYGMIYFYSTALDPPAVVSNLVINNCQGDGIGGKEWGNVICRDCTITNVNGNYGIKFYHSNSAQAFQYGRTPFWVWNVTVDGSKYAVCENAYDGTITDIYNTTAKNSDIAFRKCLYGDPEGRFYITNSTAVNCKTIYSAPSGQIRVYELADVLVVDKNNQPVNEAIVSFAAETSNLTNYCINRELQDVTTSHTLANGHTPLPKENADESLALLRLLKDASSEQSGFTYTIRAEKEGFANSIKVQPDASWYRTDPDTYCNTIKIVLPIVMENGIVSGRLTVFPNPYIGGRQQDGNIVFGRLPKSSTIMIYNAGGNLVKKIPHITDIDGEAERWDVSEVASGTYLYIVSSPEHKLSGKVSVIK